MLRSTCSKMAAVTGHMSSCCPSAPLPLLPLPLALLLPVPLLLVLALALLLLLACGEMGRVGDSRGGRPICKRSRQVCNSLGRRFV